MTFLYRFLYKNLTVVPRSSRIRWNSLSPRCASTTTATTTTTTSTSTSTTTTTWRDVWNPTPEHHALRTTLQAFVQQEIEPQAMEYNRQERFNLSLFQRLASELGILGLTIPEEYGGTGMDAVAVALVHEELSYSDPAFCLSYLAHSLLLGNNLAVNASPDQCAMYLPDICHGRTIGGMGMSEPNAGTDVLGMKTTATKHKDDDNVWILNGTKMWITNGTITGTGTGDIFLVYARTGPHRQDITQFIVTKGMPGFTLGQPIKDKLGMRASPTAELVFDHVPVPAQNVVGEVHRATLCMMRNLEIERIGLAAMGLGIARRCIDEMKRYAADRQAFGKSLWDYGQIQKYIAESYAEYMAGRCYVYALAKNLDLNTHGNGLDADGTKLYCAQMSKNVADRAIQVLGGYGYVGEYTVERLWRDAKLLEIGGGTMESHHKNMCRDLRKMGDMPLE